MNVSEDVRNHSVTWTLHTNSRSLLSLLASRDDMMRIMPEHKQSVRRGLHTNHNDEEMKDSEWMTNRQCNDGDIINVKRTFRLCRQHYNCFTSPALIHSTPTL